MAQEYGEMDEVGMNNLDIGRKRFKNKQYDEAIRYFNMVRTKDHSLL